MPKSKASSPGRNQRPARSLPKSATPEQNSQPQTPHPQTPYERELTTKRRGEISELAFALAASRHGFGISRPYGDSERYDIILDCHRCLSDQSNPPKTYLEDHSRPRILRVQVKATTQLVDGLYRVNAHRRILGRAVPYRLSEIDFFAAYIIPEDSWFIIPLPHILGLTTLLFRPKTSRRPTLFAPYREAWHLLHQPDGLEFA